jgi:hypothetical protein
MRNDTNYKKHPHTARFLMAFHTAGGTNTGGGAVAVEEPETITTYSFGTVKEADDTEALAAEAGQDDLLDLVPADTAADLRTEAQTALMEKLIKEIGELDLEAGCKAASWTMGMTEHGKWTPGRGGNASDWISRLIAKLAELRQAARAAAPVVTTGTAVSIPANWYGIVKDGEVKCYTVDYGKEGTKWAGFLFLNRISSDDRFPVRNPAEKEAILAAIRADVDAARVLAATTLRRCSRCGRTLSDTKNPYFSAGLGPDCGSK